jgi:NADH-quinone oxidoreductase subunit A
MDLEDRLYKAAENYAVCRIQQPRILESNFVCKLEPDVDEEVTTPVDAGVTPTTESPGASQLEAVRETSNPDWRLLFQESQGMEEGSMLLLQGGLVAALLLLLATLARGLGSHPRLASGSRAPAAAYECGFAPFGGMASSGLFLFYRLAVFFVVFEAELVFLYPWAAALLPSAEVGALAPFLAPMAFVGALLLGYGREIQADALRVLGCGVLSPYSPSSS